MCGGGSSKTAKPKEKTLTYTPNPKAVADTSNDYSSHRGAVIASTDSQTNSPTSFGAELGG